MKNFKEKVEAFRKKLYDVFGITPEELNEILTTPEVEELEDSGKGPFDE